jgi:hypothetical protein
MTVYNKLHFDKCALLLIAMLWTTGLVFVIIRVENLFATQCWFFMIIACLIYLWHIDPYKPVGLTAPIKPKPVLTVFRKPTKKIMNPVSVHRRNFLRRIVHKK